jgi:hypothetical protein
MATALRITWLPGNKVAEDKDRFMNYIKKNSRYPGNHKSIVRQEENWEDRRMLYCDMSAEKMKII